MLKRASRPRFVDAVLRRAILEQAVALGTTLPEDAIGKQLGVSRRVVRRAPDPARRWRCQCERA